MLFFSLLLRLHVATTFTPQSHVADHGATVNGGGTSS